MIGLNDKNIFHILRLFTYPVRLHGEYFYRVHIALIYTYVTTWLLTPDAK